MCAGKHASLGICVRGNNKLGETRIPATPVSEENVSGGHIFLGTSVRGTYFPRRFCPTGQDILSILG